MEHIVTKLQDVYLLKPRVFHDARGFFMEFYSEKTMAFVGISNIFVQDNHSYSSQKGVLRGLHFQRMPFTQAKLVRVTRGVVYDVVVDLRKNSPTFLQWQGFELSEDNFHMLWVPRGFAHGFCTLTDKTDFVYKNDNFYTPEAESGIYWDDPDLKIDWPVKSPIISEKDQKLPCVATMSEFF